MLLASQHNLKTVNLFVPYYSCGVTARQDEIDLCLKKNIKNSYIDRIFLMVDDQSQPPIDDPKVTVIHFDKRPTYQSWIEETQSRELSGISLLANSDIYFNQSIACLDQVFLHKKTFLCLSRWEQSGDNQIPHPNPQWSQDVWGFNCDDTFSNAFKQSMNFGMGIPRCDNKIAYLFSVRGWRLSNPYRHLKSVHLHESDIRSYHKELDTRILGGVAYVNPCEEISDEAHVDIEIWTVRSENIQSVGLNQRLESWKHESLFGSLGSHSDTHRVETANSIDMLKAVKHGQSIFKKGQQFEVMKNGKIYYFINQNEILNARKVMFLNSKAGKQCIEEILAPGFIPAVITTHCVTIGNCAKTSEDINFWQYPCSTEKQAYENHLKTPIERYIDYENNIINTYLPLPWATYIDKAQCPETLLDHLKLLIVDYKTFAETSGFELRVHTVCQHIHWRKIIGSICDTGVTDLHLSHKHSDSTKVTERSANNLRLHCWPLIAVNYVSPERNNNLDRKSISEKSILASFIGAQMPHYRNKDRVKLSSAAEAYGMDSVQVQVKEKWHFNDVVYEEQVKSTVRDKIDLVSDIESTQRYNRILSESIFSLCPEGAGPNTLRFWESMAVGSIPVIFSDDVAIFSESQHSEDLMDCIVHWRKPIDASLFKYLDEISDHEIERKRLKLIELYPRFENYTIFDSISLTTNCETVSSDKKLPINSTSLVS